MKRILVLLVLAAAAYFLHGVYRDRKASESKNPAAAAAPAPARGVRWPWVTPTPEIRFAPAAASLAGQVFGPLGRDTAAVSGGLVNLYEQARAAAERADGHGEAARLTGRICRDLNDLLQHRTEHQRRRREVDRLDTGPGLSSPAPSRSAPAEGRRPVRTLGGGSSSLDGGGGGLSADTVDRKAFFRAQIERQWDEFAQQRRPGIERMIARLRELEGS